jgi:hypothetical protein
MDLDRDIEMALGRLREEPLPMSEQRRAIRIASGVSLATAGRLIGKPKSVIWRWEHDVSPRGENRRRYAALLRVLGRVGV